MKAQLPIVHNDLPIASPTSSHHGGSLVRRGRDVSWGARILCKIVELWVPGPGQGQRGAVSAVGHHRVPARQHLAAPPDLLVHLVGGRPGGPCEAGLRGHGQLVGARRPAVLRPAGGSPVEVVGRGRVAVEPPVRLQAGGGHVHVLRAVGGQHAGQRLGLGFGPGVRPQAVGGPGVEPLLLVRPPLRLALRELAPEPHGRAPLVGPQALALPLPGHPQLTGGGVQVPQPGDVLPQLLRVPKRGPSWRYILCCTSRLSTVTFL
jgi:hypothetical protein